MSAQRRVSTPGLRQRIQQPCQPPEADAAQQVPGNPEPFVEAPAPDTTEQEHGVAVPVVGRVEKSVACPHLYKEPAPSQNTDVCCMFLFLIFSVGLVHLAWCSAAEGDVRRVQNGFDFRGHLCGDSLKGGNRSAGEFLYWCNHAGEGRWNSPICLETCPDPEEMLLCPYGNAEVAESEERTREGEVVLVSVAKRRLAPKAAVSTQHIGKYCFPKDFVQGFSEVVSHTEGSIFDSALQVILLDVGQLVERPILLQVILALSFASGFLWIFMLRCVAHPVAHLSFILSALSLIIAGVVLIMSLPPGSMILNSLVDRFAGSAAMIRLAAAMVVGDLNWLHHWLGLGASLSLGLGMLAFGLGILVWYLWARRSIAVAADCMQEACRLVFQQPTLLFLLPVLETALSVLVVLMAGFGATLVLSTADVRASSLSVFGETVSGIYRSFHWTPSLLASLAAYAFSCLWYLEFVSAIRSFVLSYSSVHWYFDSASSKKGSWFPIFRGLAVAVCYHLGSLALGAFVLACIRTFQWILVICHKIIGDGKEHRVLNFVLRFLDGFVLLCKHVTENVNGSAYTDVVLTSSPYFTASRNAAGIMLANASLFWIRSFVLQPMQFIAEFLYASAFGWCMWAILGALPDVKLLNKLQAEFDSLASPAVVGILAACLSFVIVRAFSAVVNGVSNAILYCVLWDKQDGKLDGTGVPESFKDFVGAAVKSASKGR